VDQEGAEGGQPHAIKLLPHADDEYESDGDAEQAYQLSGDGSPQSPHKSFEEHVARQNGRVVLNDDDDDDDVSEPDLTQEYM